MSVLKQRYLKLESNVQHIFLFALLYAVALAGAGFYFLPRFLSAGLWQGTLAAGLYSLLIVIALVGAAWVFFGMTRAGAYLLLGGWLTGLLGIVLLTTGYSIAFAGLGALAIIFIGWELYGSRRAQYYVLASWLYTGLLLVVDAFWAYERLTVQDQDTLVGRNIAVMVWLIYFFMLLRQFSEYSLRTKVTIVFLSLVFASSGAITALNQTNLSQTLTDNTGRSLENLAQTSATALGDLLFYQLQKLNTLALDQSVQTGVSGANLLYPQDPQAIEQQIVQREMNWRVAFAAGDVENRLVASCLNNTTARKLREFMTMFPDFEELFVTDQYGALVAGSDLIPNYRHADKAWWSVAYNDGAGAVYIGTPEYSGRYEKFTMTLAVPIRDPQSGRVIGIINASYSPKALVNILQEATGTLAQTDLVFPNGQSLYFPGQVMLETATTTTLTDMDQLALGVADNPDAIGFLPYSAYMRHADRLKAIEVDGLLPTVQTIQQGIYPFSRKLYLYADPLTLQEKPQVASFIYYLLQQAGEETQALGYFPLQQDLKNRTLQTLRTAMGTEPLPTSPSQVSGDITLSGSVSVAPLVSQLVQRFRNEGFSSSLTVDEVGTTAGFKAYCQGKDVDVVMASRPITERERGECLKAGRKPLAFTVSQDAIAIVVSRDSFLSAVNLNQLFPIFVQADRWNSVNLGWPARKIVRFVPSGQFFDTYNTFLQTLFDRGAMLGVQPGLLSVVRELAEAGGYVDTKYYGGRESLASVQPVRTTTGSLEIDNLGWLLSLHADKERVLQPVQQQTRRNLLLAVIILMITSVVSVAFSSVIVNPVLRLTEVARAVAAGKLDTRANIRSADEIGVLASVFDATTAQLQELIGTLEQRVAERTLALQTSTEVSRRLSTILDPAQLMLEVVEQLQLAFGYYHAHIYLFDEKQEFLVMKGGTGEAGRIMLARGHKIPRGRGLVGRAAETNAPVFVPDVSTDPNWLPNPLLPETKAEVAVPISVGDQVLGVLDVQHNVLGVLSDEMVALIQGIASQVAIALQNAEAYTLARRRAQRDEVLAELSQKIQSAATIEDVLKVAVEGLGQALNVRRSGIELGLRRPPLAVSETQSQQEQQEDENGFRNS